ncbi:MAG TPA: acyl-CoA dehydrogenase family protein [Acidimicrobiales bacterium]|jgi:alkylation response protein AidB-like acyl-CoA dehydrogenase
MDFRISDDQRALAEGVRAVLAGRLPLERIRANESAPVAISPEDWAVLGETGVFSLTVPEADGGTGLALSDAVIVFEELGRALVPGPLVGTFLAATAGVVEGAATGTVQVGVHGSGGEPILVEHLASLDALLLLSGLDRPSTARLLVPAPATGAGTAISHPLDPLTPMWHLGTLEAGDPVADVGTSLSRDGSLLTAALQVGHAAEVLDLAVAYAKERQQFGKPIGTFQAIKHLCADMLVRAEVARNAVQAAACLIDSPDVVAAEAAGSGASTDIVVARAVMGAKLLADEAAITNARAAIQVHGGMGFTWEVPLHLHLKRARVLATTFGTPAQLSAALADLAAG